VLLLLTVDADKRRRKARGFEIVGNNQSHRLTAESDPIVVERPERRAGWGDFIAIFFVGRCQFRPTVMREHVEHAGDGQCVCGVDTQDAAFGDRRRHDETIS
jgi:hypothetical protein